MWLGLLFVLWLHLCRAQDYDDDDDSDIQTKTRHFSVPMAEILQQRIYLGSNSEGEIVVKYASRGSDLAAGDYLSDADNTRLLNGGLDTFLQSGEEEVIVPVVDDEDNEGGGDRLLGFVKIQSIIPRRLHARRGEMHTVWDLDEGGPAPTMTIGNLVISGTGAKLTDDKDYVPVPEGGGKCITGRDCFNHNGTCIGGQCSCDNAHTGMTGTYCQLYRPDKTKVSEMMKFRAERLKAIEDRKTSKVQSANRAMGMAASKLAQTRVLSEKHEAEITQTQSKEVPIPADTGAGAGAGASAGAGAGAAPGGSKPVKKRVKLKPKPKPMPKRRHKHSKMQKKPTKRESWNKWKTSRKEKRRNRPATVEDLYGPGKAYPEPYMAGKVPPEYVVARHKARAQKQQFIYSVKYRVGPLGITFDNTKPKETVVERVAKGMQSANSDVQAGDIVIAIDQFNTTNVNAKMSQRIMGSLGWPRIVTFEAPGSKTSKEEIARAESKRKVLISILYPPSLAQEIHLRAAEWSPEYEDQNYVLQQLYYEKDNPGLAGLPNKQYTPTACPVYMLRSPKDSFGCDVADGEYSIPELAMQIIRRKGSLEEIVPNEDGSNNRLSANDIQEIETHYPMLLMLLKEAQHRGVRINIQMAAIAKRGICTFIQKTASFASNGAKMGIVVNTVEGDSTPDGTDMPKGKEALQNAGIPVAMANNSDASLMHVHAESAENNNRIPEIYGIRAGHTMVPECNKVQSIIEDIIDAWPHSAPTIPTSKILYPGGGTDPASPENSLQNRPAFQIRKNADEGGRVAVSGENGWAFFDYHLANFGAQTEDLPLGPLNLVMAQPPFGCDPAEYTVRVTGKAVAILRGGGCSFGIKVINAQKLGATAVVIVNTDDAKTLRLMALPDEVPMIDIPCIMISRRLQHFLEAKLRRYHSTNNHLMSIQPTGVFGLYEEKNDVRLPERIEIPAMKKK
eukprot:GSChrysophyteH1.ASY1.ANO1.968.1 assembled CDS